MAANEARDREVEDLRTELAEYQDAYHAEKQEKHALIAKRMRQTHEQGTETPMAHEMTLSRIYAETQTHAPVEVALTSAGSQASTDIKSRHTQTPTYRPDEMRAEYAQQMEEAARERAFVMREKQILEHRKRYVRKVVEEHEANMANRTTVSKAFSSLASTFGWYAPGASSSPARERVGHKEKAARGWWNEDEVTRGVVGGSNPTRHSIATPRVAKSESGYMSKVKSESAKSEDLSNMIKKGKGSSSARSVASGMARPVGNTPAPSHGTVKSESSTSKSYAFGFARPVGGSARSHSGVSYSVGSAVPASSGASRDGSRHGQAISVASSSNGATSRGRPRQRKG